MIENSPPPRKPTKPPKGAGELLERYRRGERSFVGADLGGANLYKADLRLVNLRLAKLQWAKLQWTGLREADLREADLRLAKLSRADLREADLSDADLSGANLSKADLSQANLRKANLSKANLQGANLREADLRLAKLSRADLTGANLHEASLRGTNLSGANLSGRDLGGADLRLANLSEADVSEANLHKANLSGADLRLANLSETDLSKANLTNADLSGADLSKAVLRGTTLDGADLRGAQLDGADLRGASVKDALLSGATLTLETCIAGNWSAEQARPWIEGGVTVKDWASLPEEIQDRLLPSREGLTLHFKTSTTSFDRFLVEGVIFGLLGRDADCRVVDLAKVGKATTLRLQSVDKKSLRLVADALWHREWDRKPQAPNAIFDKLAALFHLEEIAPALTDLADRLDKIELRVLADDPPQSPDEGHPRTVENDRTLTKTPSRTVPVCVWEHEDEAEAQAQPPGETRGVDGPVASRGDKEEP